MKFVVCVVLCWFASECRGQTAWTMLPAKLNSTKQMRFFDRDTGIAIAGYPKYNKDGSPTTSYPDSLFKTTDGGVTWKLIDLPMDRPYHLFDFYMLHGEIWLGCSVRASGSPTRLLRSIDVGNTWKVIPFDSTKFPFAICFASSLVGYMMCYRDSTSNPDSILFSSDGGNLWHNQCERGSENTIQCGYYPSTIMCKRDMWFGPDVERSSDSGISFVSSGGMANYCYAGDRVWLGDGGSLVLRSTDDGATWGACSEEVYDGLTFPSTDTIGDIFCPSLHMDTGRYPYDFLNISHDRGLSWTIQPFYPNTRVSLIAVVDSLYAYATDGYNLFKTVTGGMGTFAPVDRVSSRIDNSISVSFDIYNCILNTSEFGGFAIYDVLGRTILSTRITQPETRIPLTGIPAGMYFYSYGGRTGKFVKMGTSEP